MLENIISPYCGSFGLCHSFQSTRQANTTLDRSILMLPRCSLILGALLCLSWCQLSRAEVGSLVCFYDAASYVREGPAQLALRELEPALAFCNYLIYGYAGIDAETYKLKSLNPELIHNQQFYSQVTELRQKFPHLRILLSVGGDRDVDEEGQVDSSKYLSLLEKVENRLSFKASVIAELNKFHFDGLDLSWQFPKLKPRLHQGAIKRVWSSFKGLFSSSTIDSKSEEHKAQFALLARELRVDLPSTKQLTLSMLPHVDPELFIDIPSVLRYVDFVNLGTYDFQTPQRDPHVADIPATLYPMFERDITHNVEHHVQYWLNRTANAHQLNIGITSYGRAWQMSQKSGLTGFPPVYDTEGPAPGGKQTVTPGLLSWPEICELLQPHLGQDKAVLNTDQLHKVGDPTKRFGIYAYRSARGPDKHGLWVGYEDPTSAAAKASYAQAQGLGGVAFHDLSLDDFRGQCAGEKFPILRSVKYKL